MTADALINALPDLAVLVRRDGVVLAHGGGAATAALRPPRDCARETLESVWPAPVAALLRHSTRKAIASRAPVEAPFEHEAIEYELRASPQGPDRALCVVRRAPASSTDSDDELPDGTPRPQLDRRGFLRRFRESTALAALAETPLAIAIIQLDGVTDIARLIDAKVAEQVMSAAVLRLPTSSDTGTSWYLGQLGEGLLALVLDTAERDTIESSLAQLCASLREPVPVGDAEFHLAPYVGVAVLGQDAGAPKALVDNARAAALEAQRDGSGRLHFFSDSLRLRSLARLDSARELREAIANRDIRLHYVGRHDLATGRLFTRVGYLTWAHPVRGEVRPAEFVGVAETTGLALSLSRAALECLADDFAARRGDEPGVRLSFGPLRHHVLHADFVSDLLAFLARGTVPAERLEIRIAERTFVAVDPATFDPLVASGVQIVVDEVARRMVSFDRLARGRISALQLDRAWVTALRTDPVAHKVCRAGIAVATALGLTPIATGVDDEAQRDALIELGCRYGTGDLYSAAAETGVYARQTASEN